MTRELFLFRFESATSVAGWQAGSFALALRSIRVE
jgi:hypothetical protein